MRVVIGNDRSGFPMKGKLVSFLRSHGYELIDVGTSDAEDQCPFPLVARTVTDRILRGEADRGIISGGTGIGGHIAANKVPGIRAALVHDMFTARECVRQLDVRVMCLGGEIIGEWQVYALARAFLEARFDDGDLSARALVAELETLEP